MDAERFLSTYKRAWESRDADLAASLFTEDAEYWETPFGEPLRGREGVRRYWQAATSTQESIHFTAGKPLTVGSTLIAEWGCTYRHRPSGQRRELAGVLLAEFVGEAARVFREYWHRRVL